MGSYFFIYGKTIRKKEFSQILCPALRLENEMKITILNPRNMILYIEQDETEWEMVMEQYCKKYLPERVLPNFIYSNTYKEDYFYGLAILGTTLLYEELGQATCLHLNSTMTANFRD